jgi:hypothetical protein
MEGIHGSTAFHSTPHPEDNIMSILAEKACVSTAVADGGRVSPHEWM